MTPLRIQRKKWFLSFEERYFENVSTVPHDKGLTIYYQAPDFSQNQKSLEFKTSHIDLTRSEDQLLKDMAKNTRYEINRFFRKDKLDCQIIANPQDSDDLSLPDRFERQIDLFRKNPRFIIVGTDLAFINENDDVVEKRTCSRNKFQAIQRLGQLSVPFGHGSIMIRKSAFEQVNGYDESYPVSQDFDLLLRLSQLDGEMGSVPEILYQWRVHPKSVTSKKWWVQLMQVVKVHKHVRHILPNAYSNKNFIRFLCTKLLVGFSYTLFSPEAFYHYRMAAQSFNDNVELAQTYFDFANQSSRISLPSGALPMFAKLLKLKHHLI